MSNLRINTLVPDNKLGSNNIVNLPGDFRVGGRFTAASVTITEALSLGNVLKVGEGIAFTNPPVNGALPFVRPATDGSGILISGNSETSLGARLAIYGTDWSDTATAGSLTATAPGNVFLAAGNGTNKLTMSAGTTSLSSSSFLLPAGSLNIGHTGDPTSSVDATASIYAAGGVAVAKSLLVGLAMSASTVRATGSSAAMAGIAGTIAIGIRELSTAPPTATTCSAVVRRTRAGNAAIST